MHPELELIVLHERMADLVRRAERQRYARPTRPRRRRAPYPKMR